MDSNDEEVFIYVIDPNQSEYIKKLNAPQEDLFYQMKNFRLQMTEAKVFIWTARVRRRILLDI